MDNWTKLVILLPYFSVVNGMGIKTLSAGCNLAHKNMALRWIASIVCVWGLLAGGVVAASAAESNGGTVTIRAESLPTPGSSGPAADANRTVLRAFLDRNPDIEIEPSMMPQVGESSDASALMAIAAGNAPDIMYVNFRKSSTYVDRAFLAPLEVLLARLHSKNPKAREWDAHGKWLADPSKEEVAQALKDLKARIADPAWPVISQPGDENRFGPGPHVWSLPTRVLVRALLYRRDLFVQAGLDPDQPPKTWDEMLEYAQKLTVPQRNQYAFAFSIGYYTSWYMYDMFVANGGRAVERLPDGRYKAVYDSPQAAEAVYYFWKLCKGRYTTPDGQVLRGTAALTTQGKILWERGQIAMQQSYLDDEMLSNLNPRLVGLGAEPASWRGTQGGELNCAMLGVFSQSPPEKQLAAMKYIWFVTGDQANELTTRMFVQAGMGPFVNPNMLSKFGYDYILKHVDTDWLKTYKAALSHGVPEPYGKNTQNIYLYMSEPINTALEMDFEGVPKDAAIKQIQRLLHASTVEADRKLFGDIPPAEMRHRRIMGGGVLAMIVLAFVGGLVYVWRYFTKVARPQGEEKRNRKKLMWGYLLLAPALGLVLLWQYIPLLGGFAMSVADYELVKHSTFVGVDNFANVLFDEKFWTALGKTLYYVALMIGLGFWPPILLAILLQEIPTATAKYVYRTIYYLPAVLSGVIVMFLWRQMYDPTSGGTFNQLLLSLNHMGPVVATIVKWVLLILWLSFVALFFWLAWRLDELKTKTRVFLAVIGAGLLALTLWPVVANPASLGDLVGRFTVEPLRWIQSPQLAMLCVVIPLVWAASGPGCIIYLAALKGVSDDLYEAAEIDGAGFWHKVVYIVLPRMKFLIVIQFIAAVIGAFKGGTDYILALTGGGPNGSTTILALEIFFRSFLGLDFGIGTAMAWILGALLIGFTAWQLKMLSNAEFSGGR